MEIRYDAIVLRKREVGETDRLYTLYTRTAGKVQLIAKGVRKSEAKLAGQLETLMQGLIIVVKGKGSGRIVGAVAEQSFLPLRMNGDVLKRVLEIVHLFERLIDWDESDEKLFNLLALYLKTVDSLTRKNEKEKVYLVTEGFLVQMFSQIGYMIETNQCVVSGNKLEKGKKYFFSPSAGGIVSQDAYIGIKDAFLVSENSIKLIRLFLSNTLDTFSRITIPSETLQEIHNINLRFSQWIER